MRRQDDAENDVLELAWLFYGRQLDSIDPNYARFGCAKRGQPVAAERWVNDLSRLSRNGLTLFVLELQEQMARPGLEMHNGVPMLSLCADAFI